MLALVTVMACLAALPLLASENTLTTVRVNAPRLPEPYTPEVAGPVDVIFRNGFEPVTVITEPVPQQPFAGNVTHKVLVANDLGMHCADIDYQVFSILPPFNVLHAQVIERGNNPRLITANIEPGMSVVYSAAANPDDPILSESHPTMPASLNPPVPALNGTPRAQLSINSTSQNDTSAQVLKGNFWLTNPQTGNPYGFDGYDNIFFGLLTAAAVMADVGLPVPDSILLPGCLSNPATCLFEQQHIPGESNPYVVNQPKPFTRFEQDVNFFSSVLPAPLGRVIANANWWAAEGIPMLPVDDAGRTNPYPLQRVQAVLNGQVLASTDVVLPIAAEADCQNCHAEAIDCADTGLSPLIQSDSCTEAAISPTAFSNTQFEVINLEEAPGLTFDQKLFNAAKINILRLHDVKHGQNYPAGWGTCNAAGDPNNTASWNANCLVNRTPLQCSQCHYSPALDLAQLGPTDDAAHQVFQQTVGLSMSSVMHKFHGQFDTLFPLMPPPDQPIRNLPATANGFPDADPGQTVTEYVLQETCFQCHPGKRTRCLRGAMANGGVVCQDCHGEMTDVGHDFTSGGSRVPWASEPACQSCHTGDALNPNHPAGAIVAPDGLRLLQAYVDDANSPIRVPSSRFAENEQLYRLSGTETSTQAHQGHQGIMCEGCHGSTHAIWPNANASSNDNVAAIQLQGHAGTITECSTCHTGSLGLSQNGPHGLHEISPVSQNNGQIDPNASITFWNKEHEDATGPGCKSCHGVDGLGTVLSRAFADRTMECHDVGRNGCQRVNVNGHQRKRIFVPKGTEISCDLCHENKINGDD